MCGRLNTATDSLPYLPTSGEFYFPSLLFRLSFSLLWAVECRRNETTQAPEPKFQEALQLMSSLSKNPKLELHVKSQSNRILDSGKNKFVIFQEALGFIAVDNIHNKPLFFHPGQYLLNSTNYQFTHLWSNKVLSVKIKESFGGRFQARIKLALPAPFKGNHTLSSWPRG